MALAEHSRFFNHLVDLIPAKHYYDDAYERLDTKFMKKAARDAAKQHMKESYKQAKRKKLDPDSAPTVLAIQKQRLQQGKGGGDAGSKEPAAGGAGAAPTASLGPALNLSAAPASRQELLERLHKRLEEARAKKKAKAEKGDDAKKWREKTLEDNAKAKLQQGGQAAGAKRKQPDGSDAPAGKQQQQQRQQQEKGVPAQKKAKPTPGAAPKAPATAQRAEVEEAFTFGRIEVGESERREKGKRKPSTAELLVAAEAKKQELQQLEASEEGKAKVQAAAWRAALDRARGERVLDDPKLLRKALKKDAKRKEKSNEAWVERRQQQEQQQEKRQAKRTTNLARRRDTKLKNKIERREKKLLRPGFEGRKEGFIGQKAAAGAGGKAAAAAKK